MEVQFDRTRTLEDYNVKEMIDYRQWLRPFFDFYSNNVFEDNVLCTYYGSLIQKDDYPLDVNMSYAVTIPAPLLRHSIITKCIKDTHIAKFMEACRFSYKYFDKFVTRDPLLSYYGYDPFALKTEE